MPGIVYLGALIFGVIGVAILALIIGFLIRKLFKFSKSTSAFLAISISVLASLWVQWLAFGEHHDPINVSGFGETFPELAKHGAKGVRGHRWISGLSDGEYYQFEMEGSLFKKFARKYHLSLMSKTDVQRGLHKGHSAVLGGIAPDWMPKEDCEGGQAYQANRQRSEYFSRFDYYFCPTENTGYMAWVRI